MKWLVFIFHWVGGWFLIVASAHELWGPYGSELAIGLFLLANGTIALKDL